jgi:hypothetical protein
MEDVIYVDGYYRRKNLRTQQDEHEAFLPFPVSQEGKRWAKKHV